MEAMPPNIIYSLLSAHRFISAVFPPVLPVTSMFPRAHVFDCDLSAGIARDVATPVELAVAAT